jgi:hypothetical protein
MPLLRRGLSGQALQGEPFWVNPTITKKKDFIVKDFIVKVYSK